MSGESSSLFSRPPRIQPVFIPEKITIPPPPTLPREPTINWLAVTLPTVAMVAVVAVMLVFFNTGGFSYLLFLPLIAVSAVVTFTSYELQKRDYDKAVAKAEGVCERVLEEKKLLLQGASNGLRDKSLELDPDLSVCLDRAQRADIHLGERRPSDSDFLAFRLGKGKPLSHFEIEVPPKENRVAIFDGYYNTADEYKERLFSHLIDSPLTADLKSIGCLGIVGKTQDIHDFARASIIHLLSHHWPSELQVMVFCRLGQYKEWEWLKNVPHRTTLFASKHSPVAFLESNKESGEKIISDESRAEFILPLQEELRSRQNQRQKLGSQSGSLDKLRPKLLPGLVIVFDHIPDVYDVSAFSMILNETHDLNVYGIFLCDKIEDVPGECGAIVQFGTKPKEKGANQGFIYSSTEIIYQETGPDKPAIDNITADKFDAAQANSFAEALGQIEWLVPSEISSPPAHAAFLDLFGIADVDSIPVEEWWSNLPPFQHLRAPIGKRSQGEILYLDLKDEQGSHGPHGLVGGTTGSGKSELLKTLVLSFALTHHPYEVNFALIDYKGGSAFKELEQIPHVVGVITDIEENEDYARRVVLALESELQHRKQILLAAQKRLGIEANIKSYNESPIRKPLPRLIVIFDEFAEFKDRHPDESRKLVSFYRQARSYGVHLVLCTQNPKAVVDGQIKMNSRFRISLRVNSKEDSQELIGSPDAWDLRIGRAFFQVQDRIPFQVAYVDEKYPVDDSIIRIQQDGKRELVYEPPIEHYNSKSTETEFRAVIRRIDQAAQKLRIPPLDQVWRDPLPSELYLMDLLIDHEIVPGWNGQSWKQGNKRQGVILGLLDDPDRQDQPLWRFNDKFSGSDHLIVFGGLGSGKSTLLVTAAVSLALMNTPEQAQIYCLDFGASKTLEILRDLPHLPAMGGILGGNQREAINRLFSMLRVKHAERQAAIKTTDWSDLDSFNEHVTEAERLPLLYLLIDGLGYSFLQTMPEFEDQLVEVLKFSSSGIHVLISANSNRDIPTKISQEVQDRIYLGKGEKDRIDAAIGQPPAYYIGKNEIPIGRGLRRGTPIMELQVALPTQKLENVDLWQGETKRLIQEMNYRWGEGPRPDNVLELPAFVPLTEMRGLERDLSFFPDRASIVESTLGVSQETLKSIGLSLDLDGPSFMIASDFNGAGKTTLIQTLLVNLVLNYTHNEIRLVIVDFASNSLKEFADCGLIVWRYVGMQDDFAETLDAINVEIEDRRQIWNKSRAKNPTNYDKQAFLRERGTILIIIDDFNSFRTLCEQGAPPGKTQFDELARLFNDGQQFGIRWLVAETASLFGSNTITNNAKKVGSGVLLGSSDYLNLFNETKLGSGRPKTSNLPKGRGYLVRRGEAQLFQSAVYWDPSDVRSHQEQLKSIISEI